MKILIIQTAFIGDVILATSLVETLAKSKPEAEISFMLRNGNESLVANNPHIKKVLIWDKKGGKWKSLRQLIAQVRSENFDEVINLQRFGSTGFLTWRSGAKNKVGFSKNPFSFSFEIKKEHQVGERSDAQFSHEIERNHSLIEHLVPNAEAEKPRMYPSSEDFSAIGHLVAEPFVTMAPASVWFTKQFPKAQWILLCNQLNTRVLLIGGPGDGALCDEIIAGSENNRIENLAGKLSFTQSAALMSKASMNYVNDSAPLHMASAMNAPVTAFFCSTIPQFGFGPLSENSRVVEVSEELDCRPCGLHGHAKCPQGHFKCGEEINLEGL